MLPFLGYYQTETMLLTVTMLRSEIKLKGEYITRKMKKKRRFHNQFQIIHANKTLIPARSGANLLFHSGVAPSAFVCPHRGAADASLRFGNFARPFDRHLNRPKEDRLLGPGYLLNASTMTNDSTGAVVSRSDG